MPTFIRGIHVTAAVIGVGGLAFLLLVLNSSLGVLQPEQHDLLAKQVMDRFRWVLWTAIIVLLVSGLYSIREYYWEVAWGKSWALLTVKIVLALVAFVIALALTLPLKLFDWVRARRQVWLSIAVGLAVAVIFISAYLRPR
jgi:putative copper export protein